MADKTFTLAIVGADGAIGQVHLYAALLKRAKLAEEGVDLQIAIVVRNSDRRAIIMSGKGDDWNAQLTHNNLGVDFPENISMEGVTAYERVSDLLKAVTPDAAIIATPTVSHAEIAELFIKKGVHVLIEKPMAFSDLQCSGLLNLGKEHSAKVLVGHELLFFPEYAWLQSAIRTRAYGALTSLRCHREIHRDNPVAHAGFADRFKNPAFDLWVHDINMALSFFGVSALQNTLSYGQGFDDGFVVWGEGTLIFEGGVVVTCSAGARTETGFRHAFHATFKDGTVAVFDSGFATNGKSMPLQLIPTGGGHPSFVELEASDPITPFSQQLDVAYQHWVDGAPALQLDGELGAQTVGVANQFCDSMGQLAAAFRPTGG